MLHLPRTDRISPMFIERQEVMNQLIAFLIIMGAFALINILLFRQMRRASSQRLRVLGWIGAGVVLVGISVVNLVENNRSVPLLISSIVVGLVGATMALLRLKRDPNLYQPQPWFFAGIVLLLAVVCLNTLLLAR